MAPAQLKLAPAARTGKLGRPDAFLSLLDGLVLAQISFIVILLPIGSWTTISSQLGVAWLLEGPRLRGNKNVASQV